MLSNTFIDNQGRRVGLGPELGRGGEATVYCVEGAPELVAKIYHQDPSAERAEKLSQMVALQDERLLALAAWPVGTLVTPGRRSLAGFLMRNMKGFKDIHLLYNPKSRTREFSPKANWRFLIHTASNVARAFSAIHDHGHVIGDVNQSNLRVSPETAIVSLVDCDSFQISSNEKVYTCEVGVPLYTPPELQETEFREVVRTPNHDNFGLGVLIFHLLFMGRHPFAGKFLGSGEMPIEKAIAEERFAFANDVQRTKMLPPPSCITLAHLPQDVGELFTGAFSPESARGGRPVGRQWIAALDALANRLIVCSTNKAHLFFNGLASCPWCPIEASGVLLFVDYAIVDTTSGFSIEAVWSRILAVPSPGLGKPPSLVPFMANVEPSARAKRAVWKRRGKVTALAVGLLAVFGFVVSSDVAFQYLMFFGFVVRALWGALASDAPSEFTETARAAEARLRTLEHSWKDEASGEQFQAKLDSLRALAQEYRQLVERRKSKFAELARASYKTQLQHHLEQFDISCADIPYVKDGRKAMLLAYGINDAADLTRPSLQKVPGFTPLLIAQLMAWRRWLEAKFKFDPSCGIDPADIQRVDQEVAKRRAEIELLLSKGPAELNDLRRRTVAARGRLQNQLEQALMDVAQAQADERAAV